MEQNQTALHEDASFMIRSQSVLLMTNKISHQRLVDKTQIQQIEMEWDILQVRASLEQVKRLEQIKMNWEGEWRQNGDCFYLMFDWQFVASDYDGQNIPDKPI